MRTRVLSDEEADEAIKDGDVVDVTLTSLMPHTIKWTDKQTGAPQARDVWEWTFETKGTQTWVRGSTPPGLRGKNQTRAWCEALVGQLPDGFEFDTDSLIGLTCRVKVKHGKPYVSRKSGKEIVPLNVDEVYPES